MGYLVHFARAIDRKLLTETKPCLFFYCPCSDVVCDLSLFIAFE